MLTVPALLYRRICASLIHTSAITYIHSRIASSTCTAVSTGMHGASNEHASATANTTTPTTTRACDTLNSLKNHVKISQSLADQCEFMHRRVYDLLAREPHTERIRDLQRQTRISLAAIGDALQRYTLDELSLSYNGGKDCLVLLVLYLAALHIYATGQQVPSTTNNTTLPPTPPHSQFRSRLPATLRSVYIVSPNPFPQVTAFVTRSAAEYHLSLANYSKPMKEAFAAYLNDYPSVRAIFVGTRRTDPHGAKLTHFDPTDGGWPAFMRIHPVIDWHYIDIWTFIKELGVDYCELYDMGYTSLGGTDDTHPNPKLLKGKMEDGRRYRPAYELMDDEEERLGRD